MVLGARASCSPGGSGQKGLVVTTFGTRVAACECVGFVVPTPCLGPSTYVGSQDFVREAGQGPGGPR